VNKDQLAQLQAAISEIQYMNGMLSELSVASEIGLTMRGNETGTMQITPEDEEFSQVLSIIKSAASRKAALRMAEIEALIANLKG